MNKQKVAQQVDHILKETGLKKNIIKGMGWKGNGHRYYTGGFIIGTSLPRCVTISYRMPHELLSLKLTMVDDSQLTDYGIKHKRIIQEKTGKAIADYKSALSSFGVEEKLNQYELPYLVITAGAQHERPR